MHPRISFAIPLLVAGTIACAAGILPPSLEVVRSALLVFVFVFSAATLGPTLAPRLPRAARWLVSGLTVLGGQSIIQTIWYYTGGHLGAFIDGLALAGSVWGIALFLAVIHSSEEAPEEARIRVPIPEAIWALISVLSCVSASLFLVVSASRAATPLSVNSPWPLFPDGTVIACAVLFASCLLAGFKARKEVAIVLTGVSLLTLASLTTLLYPLGYGFDGFLHRASEAVMLASGTLTPAPPSYIGQYTIVTWLTRVLRIPHTLGDLWFLGGIALFLPLAAAHLRTKKQAPLAIVGLLLALPLSLLAATTPQNVAYIFGLLALLWLIPTERTSDVADTTTNTTHSHSTAALVPWIFLGWSLATHPLAGLPFAFVCIGITVQRVRTTLIRRLLTGATLFGSLIVIPLAFSVRAFFQSGRWSWSWVTQIPGVLGWFVERLKQPATHLALWPDWANWQLYLFTFLLLGAAAFAAYRDRARQPLWLTLIAFSLTASASSWLLQTSGDFSFLISYERQDYAARLLVVAQLFLVPAALVGMSYWYERIQNTHPRMRVAALLLGMAWFSANVYNMLPRNDAAAIGHGWNVGQSDVEAVKFIDKQANGKPYTVLANQTVSAAAISSFGFKRYVGDVFYYPIPTGGPLYEQFLQMMDHPSVDIAQEAGTLGQSSLVYVVVNQYWFKSEQTIEQLKGIADRTWNVERGNAYIFLFDLSTSKSVSTTRSGA